MPRIDFLLETWEFNALHQLSLENAKEVDASNQLHVQKLGKTTKICVRNCALLD